VIKSPIIFVWENFGPMHADRCEAVGREFNGERRIIGIELAGRSHTYAWHSESGKSFEKITLFENTTIDRVSASRRAWKMISACVLSGAKDVFLCHYEHPTTFLTALTLRLLGRRVYVMNDSKFDDYARHLWREAGKWIMYSPYVGGVASGVRARDYLRFLGVPAMRITGNYNSLSVDRIRRLAGTPPAPEGTPFSERHLLIVARLVPKKNLFVALDAFHLFLQQTTSPRLLHICGSGPLEDELKAYARRLEIEDKVIFHGFVQIDEICRLLGSALVLIMPSLEEQFGNAALEALALGVPVIVSHNCGVRDQLVRTAINGFVVEPDNIQGIAYFLDRLASDASLWTRMSLNADRFISQGDASNFAAAVRELIKRTVLRRHAAGDVTDIPLSRPPA